MKLTQKRSDLCKLAMQQFKHLGYNNNKNNNNNNIKQNAPFMVQLNVWDDLHRPIQIQ